ncbi:MAG TPA: A/G-specific adenine glycosylase [Beijerinckiaceae bacterium]|nr:A/G-specific adenine glycosylase [Beijerinckiaceae bacterium]
MTSETAEIEAKVAPALLAWYARHQRKLPWRVRMGAADPYAVWLSEIMLQQTTVTAVKPYYAAFLARWPTIADLAAAPLDDVMRAWAGLGYYARARNLHACAGAVAQHHGGVFPTTESELRALPGIGAYTAAAIAAIAFDRRAVVVDGNVERVVARLFAIEEPLPAAKPKIRAAAERITPAKRCGDFAQAMMDLGSMICTPRDPVCSLCPLASLCRAHALGKTAVFPARAAKAPRPTRRGAAFFIERADGFVLVRTREGRGLLGGMTEIPGSKWKSSSEESETGTIDLRPPLPVALDALPGSVDHVFTHFALSLSVYRGDVASEIEAPSGFRFVSPAALDAEALPSLMRKVVAHARAFSPPVSPLPPNRDLLAEATIRRRRTRRKKPPPPATS